MLVPALALFLLSADPSAAPVEEAAQPSAEEPPPAEPTPAATPEPPTGEPAPLTDQAAPASAVSAPEQPAPVAAGPHPTRFRGAIESLVASFPSGTPGGAQDIFLTPTPLLGFDGGDDFGFELGAELRLRVFDDQPLQTDGDYGHLVRRRDWDETSDFGQILRELRIGPEEGAFAIRAGPLLGHTLGHGHLVSRFANRDDPDYHPLGATAHLVLGPTRSEFLISDVLAFASRLLAAETSVDMGRVMSTDAGQFDRYHLAFSLAHDEGATGYRGPRLTMAHIDFDVALHRSAAARVFAYTGLGSRILVAAPDLGALIGITAEGAPGGVQLGGRAELRKQAGGFRHGAFGPGYELSRFSSEGLDGEPLAQVMLPDAFSGYAELSVASGPQEGAGSRIVFSAAAEYFSWSRLDTDASIALRLFDGKLITSGRMVVTGLGQRPRYLATAEARYRFAPAFY
ncbi:MAG: hypothetical protein ACYC8T_38545, partial [Myxococcaceae bacterium]